MRLRLVFLGSDPIALPLLEWLATDGGDSAEVVAVYTQPDRPAGRGQQVVPNAIKTWAIEHGLPVLQPDRLGSTAPDDLRAFQPDVSLVMAYGHILKDDFIGVPRLGTLNLHTSLLPRYRGASPIQTAVASGDNETGVTLMRIVRALDAGPVADAERVSIDALETASDVEAKLARACVPLVARNLPRLASGEVTFVEQDHAAATYCRRLVKADGQLDFNAPAATLAARINGLFPWPGCATEMAGQVVKLGLADALSQADASSRLPAQGGAPGTVLGHDSAGLLVATGNGVVRLRRLQRPGGRMLPAGDFLRGFPIEPGAVLPSRPMAPLVANEPFRS